MANQNNKSKQTDILKNSNENKEIQKDLFGQAVLTEKDNVYLSKNKNAKQKRDLSDSIETKYIVEIVCNDAHEQEFMYNELIKKGFTCQILTL